MVTKVFAINTENGNGYNLSPDILGHHESGWYIVGDIIGDAGIFWVNDFSAFHTKYGKVWGDFETIVYADTEEGLQHFMQHHPPQYFDYADI